MPIYKKKLSPTEQKLADFISKKWYECFPVEKMTFVVQTINKPMEIRDTFDSDLVNVRQHPVIVFNYPKHLMIEQTDPMGKYFECYFCGVHSSTPLTSQCLSRTPLTFQRKD